MNWSYIAGFFDGEGNTGTPLCHSSILLNITQSGDKGKLLLDEIKEYLLTFGIIAKVRPRTPIPNRKQCYMLWVRPSTSLLFLRAVLPYLRIKRTIAQDLIRFKLLYPSITTSPLAFEVRKEHAIKANAPRNKDRCIRGHEYTVGSGRKWCRECLKLYYKNKVARRTKWAQ